VTYKVIFRKSAEQEFRALSNGKKKAIHKEIKKLEKTDKPAGYKELAGYSPLKRIKSGGVRAVYDAPDAHNRIFILRIGTDHSVYFNLEALFFRA